MCEARGWWKRGATRARREWGERLAVAIAVGCFLVDPRGWARGPWTRAAGGQ